MYIKIVFISQKYTRVYKFYVALSTCLMNSSFDKRYGTRNLNISEIIFHEKYMRM